MSSINNEEKLSIAVKAGITLASIIVILVISLYVSIGNTNEYKSAADNERAGKIEAITERDDLKNDYDDLRSGYEECVYRYDNNEERLIENVRAVKESNTKAAELQEKINEAARARDAEKKRAEAAAKQGEKLIRAIVVGTGSQSE